MPAKFQAILFDFDGVLVNSETLHLRAFQRVGKQAGFDVSEADYVRDVIGFDDRGGWLQLAKSKGVTLDPPTLLALLAVKAMAVREMINEKKYLPLPGVEALVRGLWRHYPLAVVTGALRDEVEVMLEGIKLRDCFRTVIAAEDVTNGKPDPEGYLKATAELGRLTGTTIRPQDTLIFEDAPRVIERVKKVRFQTVGVQTYCEPEELKAKYTVASMRPVDVRAAIKGIEIFEEITV